MKVYNICINSCKDEIDFTVKEYEVRELEHAYNSDGFFFLKSKENTIINNWKVFTTDKDSINDLKIKLIAHNKEIVIKRGKEAEAVIEDCIQKTAKLDVCYYSRLKDYEKLYGGSGK